jgi:hypothetical protein
VIVERAVSSEARALFEVDALPSLRVDPVMSTWQWTRARILPGRWRQPANIAMSSSRGRLSSRPAPTIPIPERARLQRSADAPSRLCRGAAGLRASPPRDSAPPLPFPFDLLAETSLPVAPSRAPHGRRRRRAKQLSRAGAQARDRRHRSWRHPAAAHARQPENIRPTRATPSAATATSPRAPETTQRQEAPAHDRSRQSSRRRQIQQ